MEIEVGFRDQKTLIGCGQAQVRGKNAVQKVPAFISACYCMILLASHITNLTQNKILPGSKWYKNQQKSRVTTGDILNKLRTEGWMQSVNINFSDFVNIEEKLAKLGKMANPVFSSILHQKLIKLKKTIPKVRFSHTSIIFKPLILHSSFFTF